MSDRDKRTLMLGGVFVLVYLVIFYGRSLLGVFEGDRRIYFERLEEAYDLGEQFRSYETKIMKIEKLREIHHFQPRTLQSTNLVGNVGRAIQDMVKQTGFNLGQIREVPGRGGQGVAATLQLEGEGPLKSLLPLVHRFHATGFPLIIDSMQIRAEQRKPGAVSWSVDVIILDYERWKKEGGRRA